MEKINNILVLLLLREFLPWATLEMDWGPPEVCGPQCENSCKRYTTWRYRKQVQTLGKRLWLLAKMPWVFFASEFTTLSKLTVDNIWRSSCTDRSRSEFGYVPDNKLLLFQELFSSRRRDQLWEVHYKTFWRNNSKGRRPRKTVFSNRREGNFLITIHDLNNVYLIIADFYLGYV